MWASWLLYLPQASRGSWWNGPSRVVHSSPDFDGSLGMQRRFRRKLMLAGLLTSGGFLFGAQSTSCLSFTGESVLSSANFCFIFDCQNGILGGTIDPCSETRDANGNLIPPTFLDCPNRF